MQLQRRFETVLHESRAVSVLPDYVQQFGMFLDLAHHIRRQILRFEQHTVAVAVEVLGNREQSTLAGPVYIEFDAREVLKRTTDALCERAQLYAAILARFPD